MENVPEMVEEEILNKLKGMKKHFRELGNIFKDESTESKKPTGRQDTALFFKKCGNLDYKHGFYKEALQFYTNGIEAQCGDLQIEAALYNNRAAAHYALKDYCFSLDDCEVALKLKPDYKKSIVRAANCCHELGLRDTCERYCVKALEIEPGHEEMLQLRRKNLEARCVKAVEHEQLVAKRLRDDALVRAVGERINRTSDLYVEELEPCSVELAGHRVRFDGGMLVWPVIFLYHELKMMVFIRGFRENEMVGSYVCTKAPNCSMQTGYELENVNIYYVNVPKVYKVGDGWTLVDALKQETFVLKAGTPVFHIVPKNSEAEVAFLCKYELVV